MTAYQHTVSYDKVKPEVKVMLKSATETIMSLHLYFKSKYMRITR